MLGWLTGCSHQKTTFPQKRRERTDVPSAAVPVGGIYVVCLDCGKEMPYDWDNMRVARTAPAAGAPRRSRWTEAFSRLNLL
ncbi:MAG: hypothetical protein SFV54_17045 [Bryobacteraceae bacterium]|nr:hypothetical protein [Bryobacteraceae bacterium]